jgi:hypothetical protein
LGISPIEFRFLKLARDTGAFEKLRSILEFGESNTHQLDISAALSELIPVGLEREAAEAEAERIRRTSQLPGYPWARLLYGILFNGATYTAIDLEPKPPHVVPQDLNVPFDLGRRFDLCINNGTSEHIFNQPNFYKAMHDHTRMGGLMAHWTPCLGWINHGLYNVQPGFFHDLARDNAYEIVLACLGTAQNLYRLDPEAIGDEMLQMHPDLRNALACVLLRKTAESPFRFPLQGTYRHLAQYAQTPN